MLKYLFYFLITLGTCQSNPCKYGSCHALGATEVVPEFEKPRWAQVKWIQGVLVSSLMKQRMLDARNAGARRAAPGWNGRQKRMIVREDGGYAKETASGDDGGSVQKATMFSKDAMLKRKAVFKNTVYKNKAYKNKLHKNKLYKNKLHKKATHPARTPPKPKTIFLPKCFQKKRPVELVKYRCQCQFGFTGYKCDGLCL